MIAAVTCPSDRHHTWHTGSLKQLCARFVRLAVSGTAVKFNSDARGNGLDTGGHVLSALPIRHYKSQVYRSKESGWLVEGYEKDSQ